MKMIKSLGHYMRVTVACIKMALLGIIEYPSAILGWLISNPIQFIVGFATIQFVVQEFGEINGWNYGQLAVLYGLSVISHALSMIFFVQGWFMGYYVIEGEFDRFLTRPMSVLYQFFFTQINIFGITDLIPGIIVFIYGCIKISFPFSLKNVVCILVMLVGATLIRGGVYLILGTSSFFTRSANDFGQYTQEIFDKTTMYPISMYPESLQFVLTYIIPIGWVSFYPVASMLGVGNEGAVARFSGAAGVASGAAGVTSGAAGGIFGTAAGFSGTVARTLVIGILVMIVAGVFFKYGLKKYESAGN